jgi:hypothetical protein
VLFLTTFLADFFAAFFADFFFVAMHFSRRWLSVSGPPPGYRRGLAIFYPRVMGNCTPFRAESSRERSTAEQDEVAWGRQ